MLILTRKVGESLWLGDDIQITMLGSKGNQIRIGISAPEEVVIERDELHNKEVFNASVEDIRRRRRT